MEPASEVHLGDASPVQQENAVEAGADHGLPDAAPGIVLDGAAPFPARVCVPPPGVSGTPQDLRQVIELINALPHPVSMGCLLESFDRPLRAYATWSIVSAQPAQGAENPRIFLFVGDSLILSIVPAGVGSEVVEFGQLTDGTRSLKGELHFPITEPLGVSAAFESIALEQGGTFCRFCHASEVEHPHDVYQQAYESQALRPNPEYEIDLAHTEFEARRCDAALTPERCDILHGVFGHGPVVRQDFPPDMPVFF